ncbi:MAG TPA: hypothetical protein VID72_07010 [Ktedonobacterales bacterium]|jgi:uncharacterized membrane protein
MSPSSDLSQAAGDDRVSRGVWAGAVPVLLLIVIVALGVFGAAMARALASPSYGFLTWQWFALGAWGGGLVIGALVYLIATRRALRRASEWQQAGLARQALGVYWTLLASALLVLAPTIIALALPQHPAP